jgi:hypothetical protein
MGRMKKSPSGAPISNDRTRKYATAIGTARGAGSKRKGFLKAPSKDKKRSVVIVWGDKEDVGPGANKEGSNNTNNAWNQGRNWSAQVTPLKGDASHASSVGSKSAIEQMTVITKQLDETNEQVKSLCEKVEHQNKSIEKMNAEREKQTETISRLEESNRELGEQCKQLQQATMLELEKVRGENARVQTELTNALIKLSERLESKGEAAKEMESENECEVVEMVQTPRATAQAVEETKKKAIPVKRAATIVKAKTTTMAKQTVRTQETRETGLVSLGKYKLGTRVSKSPGCEQIEEISSRESDTGDEAAVDPGKKN